MAQSPLFVITDIGLEAASLATPVGPFVHVVKFKVGSGFGYTPTRGDTGLQGSLLYEGVVTAYQNIGNHTIDIILKLPPDAGPFSFGEVAIYLEDDVLFAKAVFDAPQSKFSSLGSDVASTYTFHSLLKLEQSVAILKFDAISHPDVWEVDLWSDVYPSNLMANPEIPQILVKELDGYGHSSLLHKSSDTQWTIGTSYVPYSFQGPVVAASTTWVELAPTFPSDLALANRSFIMEVGGYFRSVASVQQSGANYRFNLNPEALPSVPAVGAMTFLYIGTYDRTIHWSQIIDPKSTSAGDGLIQQTPFLIGAKGLLHGPGASNTGRPLTGGDSLNNIGLPSGIYTGYAGFGYPAGWPAAWDGVVQVMHITDSVQHYVQQYIPVSTGGGDANGVGGVPMYWRAYDVPNGVWRPWFPIYSPGKSGSGTYAYRNVAQVDGWSEVNTQGLACYMFTGGNNPSASGDQSNPIDIAVAVDGISVSHISINSLDAAKVGFVSAMVPSGSTISVVSKPYPTMTNGHFNVAKFIF